MIRALTRLTLWLGTLALVFSTATGVAFAQSGRSPDFVSGTGCSSGSPTATSTSYYVSSDWNTTVQFLGRYVPKAYEEGYLASAGSPSSCSIIIVDYHRQVYDSTNNVWEVDEGGTLEPDSWASSVAQSFISGYSAGHTTPTIIAFGVSNDNVGWATGSSLWASAGTEWANVVDSLTPYGYTTIEGANDFEDWTYTYSNGTTWYSYGSDAETWETYYYNAFATKSGNYYYVADFGDQAAYQGLGAPYWTNAEVYDLAWGFWAGISYPEIYYSGNQIGWQQLQASYPSLWFGGVTSENGYGGSYTWLQSWQTLNNAIPNDVGAASNSI